MLKIPLSATFLLYDAQFQGLSRPKHFFVVALKSKSKDLTVERYVRSWPVLLRLRLALAKRAAIRSYVKVEAFKANNGL